MREMNAKAQLTSDMYLLPLTLPNKMPNICTSAAMQGRKEVLGKVIQ